MKKTTTRTNIVLDDRLVRAALSATGLPTKKAVVEAGPRMLIRVHAQAGIRNLRGKIDWEGDLDAMRSARRPRP